MTLVVKQRPRTLVHPQHVSVAGEPAQHHSFPPRSSPLSVGQPVEYLPGEGQVQSSALSFGQPVQYFPREPAPQSSALSFGQPVQYLPRDPAPQTPRLSFRQPVQYLPREPAPQSPPFGQPAQCVPVGPAPRSPPLSSGQPAQSLPREHAPQSSPVSLGQPAQYLPGEPSPPCSLGQPSRSLPEEPVQRLSVSPTIRENQRPEIFSGGSTVIKSISEVRHASSDSPARRRMIFHQVRLSAALKAFQKDKCQTSRQKWWTQNLEFELVRTQPLAGQSILTTHIGRITR